MDAQTGIIIAVFTLSGMAFGAIAVMIGGMNRTIDFSTTKLRLARHEKALIYIGTSMYDQEGEEHLRNLLYGKVVKGE